MSVDFAKAETSIFTQIIEVLQANLDTELDAIEDTGLELPRLEDAQYHILSTDQIPKSIWTQPRSLIVGQAARTRPVVYNSGDGVNNVREFLATVYVQIIFHQDGYSPLTITGRKQTLPEWRSWAAYRYQGGIVNALYKHAQDGQSIGGIECVAKDAGLAQAYNHGGLAYTEWEVRYIGNVPMDSRFTS